MESLSSMDSLGSMDSMESMDSLDSLDNPKAIINNINNPVFVNEVESGLVRSSSQSVLPLRPNLPKELFKKQQNEQNLVKHVMNHILKNSRINNTEEYSKTQNYALKNSNLINSPTCTNFQKYNHSSESSNVSSDTIENSSNVNNSLLKESKAKDSKMNYVNQELDNTFINNYLNESNVSSNRKITDRKELPNNSRNSIDNSIEITDYRILTQKEKENSSELFHLKLQYEQCSCKLGDCDIMNEYFKTNDIAKKESTVDTNKVFNTKVKLLSRSSNFKTVEIDLKNKYYLGRNNDENYPNFILFNSLVVSRHHAELFVENDKYYIRDIGSNGGTFINSKRISKAGCQSEGVIVIPGDIIQLGQDYIENDKDKDLDECVYKSVMFEILPIEMSDQKETIEEILENCDINNYNRASIVRAQSDMHLSKRVSKELNIYNDIVDDQNTKMRGKTKELYDSKLLDESTQYQLALYEKTKNLNIDEYSNINSHLLDNINKECLQYFFVIYSDKKKISKIQILNNNTECIFEISLKDWLNKYMNFDEDNKGKMHITDKRDEYSPTSSIKVYKCGDRVNIQAENYQLGFIEKIFDMKYIVKTPEQSDNAIKFCFTGDFEQQNWLCIIKFKDTRKQRCIGEAKGKQLIEKSTKHRKWVISVQMETGNYSQLLLTAAAYIIATTGPYY